MTSNAGIAFTDTGVVIGPSETANVSLDVSSATDAIGVPVGNTAQRPDGQDGYIRFNSEVEEFEGFKQNVWTSIGGKVDIQNNNTFVNATSTIDFSNGNNTILTVTDDYANAKVNVFYDAITPVTANDNSTVFSKKVNFVNTTSVLVSVTENNGNANVAFTVSGAVGSGTVTQIATGLGLTGGPITTTGTISANLASTTVQGITKLIDSVSSSETSNAATANSVKWAFNSANANALAAYAQANVSYGQANTAYTQANAAYIQANLSYAQANTVYGQANDAFNQANTARNTANGAYAQANIVYGHANVAYNQANTGRDTGNTAYSQANAAYAQANAAYNAANAATSVGSAYDQANTARNTANAAYGQANAAYGQANSAYGQANLVYGQANTVYAQANAAYGQANAAYGQANAAYTAANTRVLKTGDQMTGTLNVDFGGGNVAITTDTGFGRVEIGGTSGGYIDFKSPYLDDYDFRIITIQGTTQFISNNAAQLVAFANSNVGINVTPSYPLHVKSSLVGAQADKVLFGVDDSYNNNLNGQNFRLMGGSSGLSLQSNWGDLSLAARNDGATTFTRHLTIKAGSGNVGINTSAATSNLHVVGNANITLGINTSTLNAATINATTINISTINAASVDVGGPLYIRSNLNFDARGTANVGNGVGPPIISTGVLSRGRMLYTDPEFYVGTNNIYVYDNAGSGNVTITRITNSNSAPSNSSYTLQVVIADAFATPSYGGFYFAKQTKANQVLVTTFKAKLPTGYQFNWASNGYGTDGQQYWVSKQIGTGKWEEYTHVVVCGTYGSFSSTAFYYVNGSPAPAVGSPVVFELASATMYDITDISNPNFYNMNVRSTLNSSFAHITTANLSTLNVTNIFATGTALGLQTGTASNGSIILVANGSEAARIVNTGNVGIGTTTPNTKLHIISGAAVSGGAIPYKTQTPIFEGSATSNSGIEFNTDRTSASSIAFNDQDASARGLIIYSHSGDYLQISSAGFLTLYAGSSEKVRIDSSGNVGIGRTDPTYKLDISSTISNLAKLLYADGTYNPRLQITGSAQGVTLDETYSTLASNLMFAIAGNEKVRLTSSGYLGIGTTNPGTKLHVSSGSIYADSDNEQLLLRTTTDTNKQLILGYVYSSDYSVISSVHQGTAFKDLVISAANTIIKYSTNELARFTTSGYFGVGTSTPNGMLNTKTAVGSPHNIILSADNASSDTKLASIILNRYNYDPTGNAAEISFWRGGAASEGSIAFSTNPGGSSGASPTERVRLRYDGNFGIGTTNPTYKLVVTGGDISLNTNATYFRSTGTTGDSTRMLGINGSNVAYIGPIDAVAVGSIYSAATTSLYSAFYTSGSERVRIDATGNVGIGATSPSGILDIRSSGTTSINAFILNSVAYGAGNPAASILNLGKVESGVVQTMGAVYAAPSGPLNSTEGFLSFYTRSSSAIAERIRIENTGNVGIGTTTPGYKLEVNGSFAAVTKSFVIPHPTKPGMKLRYGSLEGPENGVYIRGRANTDIIQLPDYWRRLVDPKSITVNLTPVDKYAKLYVKEINKDHIVVGKGFFGSYDYFFTVYAERCDVDKLTVEI